MTMLRSGTPREDGFRMPAEYEPHAGTWMLWPQRPDVWRLGGKPAQRAFVEVATTISRFEPVTMGVNADQYANARDMLPGEVRVVEISNDDAWMRDCGPTFLVDDRGRVRVVDWVFNAWGGLVDGVYFPWDQDDLVAQKVAEIEGCDRYRAPLVLEGGAIHTDGQGTLIATEETLLSQGRNPQLTREEIADLLRQYLVVDTVIWLKRGICNDESNGHVDNTCCFVRPGEVLLAWTDDAADPQHGISVENLEILEAAVDAQGRRLIVHRMPMPDPLHVMQEEGWGVDNVGGTSSRTEGDPLAASYLNYYTVNGGIVLPMFGDGHDAEARALLEKLNPGREVVAVPAREILLGGGGIHCITQQQPRAAGG
jgi:agmatine deiminase